MREINNKYKALEGLCIFASVASISSSAQSLTSVKVWLDRIRVNKVGPISQNI